MSAACPEESEFNSKPKRWKYLPSHSSVTEIFFSGSKGTVLIVCNMPDCSQILINNIIKILEGNKIIYKTHKDYRSYQKIILLT